MAVKNIKKKRTGRCFLKNVHLSVGTTLILQLKGLKFAGAPSIVPGLMFVHTAPRHGRVAPSAQVEHDFTQSESEKVRTL